MGLPPRDLEWWTQRSGEKPGWRHGLGVTSIRVTVEVLGEEKLHYGICVKKEKGSLPNLGDISGLKARTRGERA